jgi:hypothetical protein
MNPIEADMVEKPGARVPPCEAWIKMHLQKNGTWELATASYESADEIANLSDNPRRVRYFHLADHPSRACSVCFREMTPERALRFVCVECMPYPQIEFRHG